MGQDLKVINLGLPKSGTTTLGKALGEAGLRVADWRVRRGDKNATAFGFVGNLMYHGYFNTGDPLSMMPNFDAFPEINIVRNGLNLWPQTDWGLLSAIRKHHPGVKFTLTYRDPAKLSDSMMRWSNLGRTRLPTNAIPGLPIGYGDSDEQRQIWITGHYNFCRQVFANADDFLEYDIEDPAAPKELSNFLGIDMPWWGVANKNDDKASRAGADNTQNAGPIS